MCSSGAGVNSALGFSQAAIKDLPASCQIDTDALRLDWTAFLEHNNKKKCCKRDYNTIWDTSMAKKRTISTAISFTKKLKKT